MGKEPTHECTVLENAWSRFATYDQNAGVVQRKFFRMRLWMLALGIAATVLAISYSHLGVPDEQRPHLLDPRFFVWLLVMLAPILGSVLSAGSSKLARGGTWINLRGGAETIKREIYYYRCRLGAYGPESEEGSREERLAALVTGVTSRLMETEVVSASLKTYDGELPPKYGAAEGDDGFSAMSPEQYLEWRVADQQSYFAGKSRQFDRRHRRFQWSIVLFGGIGTLLAALGYEIWVPVAVGAAAAVTAYIELRKLESNLAGYNRASMELDNVGIWWSALSPEAKSDPESFASLVERTETVLGSENASWLKHMQEVMSKLEKKGKG